MDIAKIDENFSVSETIYRDGMKFYDVTEKPFKIYGLIKPDENCGMFKRMPPEIAEKVSESVRDLNVNTAGGRVRFKTNSPYIAIHAEFPYAGRMTHFAITGSVGFDLYNEVDGVERYAGTFIPPWSDTPLKEYESIIDLGEGTHSVTINFPLYSAVSKLYIGLDEKSDIFEHDEYKHAEPVVYYGSSITQGGCASRPGMNYESIISRDLDTDYVNLGFSGSAKAEDAIAEYISGLKMSVFVYDYDHNAPSAEYLRNTHKKMFDKIRSVQPDLPIVIMSAPVIDNADAKWTERKGIVRDTYREAVDAGDKNVYFIDGATLLLPYAKYDGTVDGCHPTDLGFTCMAKNVEKVLEKIL